MALDKLTIINNGGLSTTSDYRVGVLTATKFVGPIEGAITATDASFTGNVSIAGTLTYEDVTNVDSIGLGTFRNGLQVLTGTATTALVVDGDARVTGILTVGSSSLTLDGTNNLVNVGTALTLGHTQGLQFHTQNLHAAGFEINNINASGIITSTGADINGDIDVDGHTNLDNVSIAGVVTATSFVGALTGNATSSDTVDITNSSSSPTTFFLTFVDNNGSGKILNLDSGLTYVPSSNVLTAGIFNGSGASLTNLNGSNIASGTVPVARIGTGTKNTSTFYRGDGTFATVTAPAITAINNATNNRVVTSEGGTTVNAESNLTFDGNNLRIDHGNAVDGILGKAYTGYFGLKHADQTLDSEYMIISNDSHTFISASSGKQVRIRYGGNDSTNELQVNTGVDGLTWRGNKIFHAGNDGSGSGLDSDTLDGVQGSSFLRSDANDLYTSGTLTITSSDDYALTFNNSANAKIDLQGSDDPYIRFREGSTEKAYIQWNSAGYLDLKNQEDNSRLLIRDNLSFTQDGTNFYKVWNEYNDGPSSGLDADTLDGVQGSGFLRSDVNDVCTARIEFTKNSEANYDTIATSTGSQGAIEIYNSGSGNDAFMTFHTGSDFAFYFGLDADTNDLSVGGWSMGNNKYRVWHAGNDGSGSGLDADLWDGNQFSSYLNQALLTSSTVNFARVDVTGSHGITNDGWFRNDVSGRGLYNTATTQHFYSDDDDYWNIAGGTSANGLRFRDDYDGTVRGYVYANSSNQIGFLNQSAAWSLRIQTNGITHLGANGFQLVDGNNANNLSIYSGTSGAAGISMYNNSSQHILQLYGEQSGAYGFLDNNWASWDIRKQKSGNFEVDEGNGLKRVWNAGNDGSGSGLDADLLDGLHAHTGRNNEANKVVRTDGSGYIQAGWINTDSGDTGTGSDCTRFYASQDNYLRYIDRGSMRSVMNVSAVSNVFSGREDYTSDSNYWTGAMGWGNHSFDSTVWDYGSCFFDVWSNPSGQPSGTSHWTGFQSMHYTNNSSRYGCRITVGAGNPVNAYIQGRWGSTTMGWYRLWNESNDHLLFSTTHNQTDQLQLKMHTNSWNGGIKFISNDGNNVSQLHMDNSSTYDLMVDSSFYVGGSFRCNGNVIPHSNDNMDLGESGLRWRNIYTTDLQLSNESKKDKGGNDVDGTWGDYTIQEGEDDLFLINNRSGKKYKFMLQEVK